MKKTGDCAATEFDFLHSVDIEKRNWSSNQNVINADEVKWII